MIDDDNFDFLLLPRLARGAKVAGWLSMAGAFLAGVVRLATEVQGIV